MLKSFFHRFTDSIIENNHICGILTKSIALFVYVNESSNIPTNSLFIVKNLLQDNYTSQIDFNEIEFDKSIFRNSYQGIIDNSYQLYRLGCEFLAIENEIVNK